MLLAAIMLLMFTSRKSNASSVIAHGEQTSGEILLDGKSRYTWFVQVEAATGDVWSQFVIIRGRILWTKLIIEDGALSVAISMGIGNTTGPPINIVTAVNSRALDNEDAIVAITSHEEWYECVYDNEIVNPGDTISVSVDLNIKDEYAYDDDTYVRFAILCAIAFCILFFNTILRYTVATTVCSLIFIGICVFLRHKKQAKARHAKANAKANAVKVASAKAKANAVYAKAVKARALANAKEYATAKAEAKAAAAAAAAAAVPCGSCERVTVTETVEPSRERERGSKTTKTKRRPGVTEAVCTSCGTSPRAVVVAPCNHTFHCRACFVRRKQVDTCEVCDARIEDVVFMM